MFLSLARAWPHLRLTGALLSHRQLLLRHPRLMAYRVTSHVAPKTKWLRERLGLGQAALRKVITVQEGEAAGGMAMGEGNDGKLVDVVR